MRIVFCFTPEPRGGRCSASMILLMQRIQSALVGNDAARVEFDIDPVPSLANLHAPPDPQVRSEPSNEWSSPRHNLPRPQCADAADKLRESMQATASCVQLLDGEQFSVRHGANVLLIG